MVCNASVRPTACGGLDPKLRSCEMAVKTGGLVNPPGRPEHEDEQPEQLTG